MSAHKATPEQWAILQDWAMALTAPTENCVFELRAKIEALEANAANEFDHIGEANKKVTG
ncbi:MAG: hypothetical protein ACO3X1_14350 [Burkholderiaceae bacterium]